MESCGTPKKYLWECLHTAVHQRSIRKLNHLLSEERIFINCCNRRQETPLFTSIKQRCALNFIKRLVTVGADVNKPNTKLVHPLHLAMEYDSTTIAELLIKNGADPNVQDANNQTPLHWAIKFSNLELVCFLLYNEADVTLTDSWDMTPFTFALQLNRTKIAEVLYGYYDNFSKCDVKRKTALDYAIENGSPLVYELITAGAKVNYVSYSGYVPLIDAIIYFNEPRLFKLIWSQTDPQFLLGMPTPFLLIYLQQCKFSRFEWLECLYLILSSPIISDLIDECNDDSFITDLNDSLKHHKMEPNDRLAIIYHCLSYGAVLKSKDLIYPGDTPTNDDSLSKRLFYLHMNLPEEMELILRFEASIRKTVLV